MKIKPTNKNNYHLPVDEQPKVSNNHSHQNEIVKHLSLCDNTN